MNAGNIVDVFRGATGLAGAPKYGSPPSRLFVADVAVTSFWVVRSTAEHLADIRDPSRVERRERDRALKKKRVDWLRL
ncbi:hypothetical protein [Thiomonas sp. FB-6]|uniref:hypothetical protein n=1 Tax=Thiomonas sp. FB-6 TaxID=1158291 RepID=UPI00056E8187|nr:hypothetical protein [Thiomonas sp. FB-6]